MTEELDNAVGLAGDFADIWEESLVPSVVTLGDELAGIGSRFAGMLQDQAEGLSILQGTSEEWDRLRDAFSNEVGNLPPTARNPVILTTLDISSPEDASKVVVIQPS